MSETEPTDTDGADRQGAVRFTRRGAVAFLTADRPWARNAMTWTMYEELEEGLAKIRGASEVRVAVLRGAGGTFISGTDIAQFREFTRAEDGVAYERRLDLIIDQLEALPVPTLAVVEGAAMGGGLALAAACDLRICTPDARFGVPIARTVGNCLSMANVARLLAHLGPSRTKALLLLAKLLGAEEARDAGFVLEVAEPAELEARVEEICHRLASHAPITLRVSKEAVRRILAPDAGGGEDLLRQAYGSGDFQRGVDAFLTKQNPKWQGE